MNVDYKRNLPNKWGIAYDENNGLSIDLIEPFMRELDDHIRVDEYIKISCKGIVYEGYVVKKNGNLLILETKNHKDDIKIEEKYHTVDIKIDDISTLEVYEFKKVIK